MTFVMPMSGSLAYAPLVLLSDTQGMNASTNSTPTPAIEIQHLTKVFGRGKKRVNAIRDLDLTIPAGEVVALVGANGAGKTTLFNMVLGLTELTSGTIELFGGPPALAAKASRVGAVMQSGGLLPDITVEETVRAIAGLHPRSALDEVVREVMEETRLTEIQNRKVRLCSGGEQQRVRFALAILPRPDLLILDEATTGMDIYARHEFWHTLRYQAQEGQAIIFATHYLEEAQRYADRAVIAATAAAGGTVVESRSGWGRQLALTPTTPGHYLTAQVLSLALRCTLPVVAVFIAGALTGATMTASAWAACFFLCIAVSLPFGVYGMASGELFRSDSAITIASTLIVVFAFAANMFMPLSAGMLDFGRFTPLYGANALANYPLTDGVQIISDEPYYHEEALPNALANIAAWAAIFVITFILLNRRRKGR